jgi:hypothetical protein
MGEVSCLLAATLALAALFLTASRAAARPTASQVEGIQEALVN